MAYLNPRSLYAAAAAIIMCADADLPAPASINDGRAVMFRIFPVKKNDLAAWAGSSAKPRAACCAATKVLVVLMVMSRLKAANGIANGSLGGEGVQAAAANPQQAFGQSPSVPRLTIVNDYAWDTQHLFHSCKSIDNIVRVGEVSCNVQLIFRTVCLPQ
jgi:hypothetical protein